MFSAVFVCLFCAFFTNVAVAACTANQIDVTGNGSNCQTSKFEVTTTNLSANDSLKFSMSAKGTFYVDCGDGGTLSGTGSSGKTISKSTNVSVTYTCEWASAGVHTVRFGGVATEYANLGLGVSSTNAAITFEALTGGTPDKIASVSGSLGELFPQLGTSSSQIPKFINTFTGASNLTSIPSTLFSGLTGGSNADHMFYGTFEDCTSLTSIPGGLFKDITDVGTSMFSQTFEGCTSLSGYVPATAFEGLVDNNHPSATTLWYDTFQNTQLATSCPNDVPQYVTGYEGSNRNTTWNGVVACGCSSEFTLENGACVCNEFSITTTSLPADTEFWFSMSPKGRFAVDWGDGNIETIKRSDTTSTAYTHTYTTAGVKTIKFCGYATEYNSSVGDNVVAAISFFKSSDEQGSHTRIATVSGSLGSVFPTLGNDANQQPRFRSTFQGASNLTTIPATLFSGVSGSADGMFRSTFDKCKKLTAIPYGLFANATGGAANMFRSTFYQCTALTSLPEDLFAGITLAKNYEFMYTLYGTTGLTGKYIPPSTFTGLMNANPPSPTTDNMWTRTFNVPTEQEGLGLVKTCPARTHQFFTGYEGTTENSTWAGYVSCEPNNPCTGTEYWDSTNEVCTPCPTGYTYDTSDTKESIDQCTIQCAAGTYLANANDTTCTNAGVGYYAEVSVVAYGSTNSPTRCPGNMPTLNNVVNASSESQCVIYCHGATYRDTPNNTCISCPVGYDYDTTDGKTADTDCIMQCDAGTYLPTAHAPSCIDVGDGYYAAAATVAYGSTTSRNQCPSGQMTGKVNASSASECFETCTGATYLNSGTGTCVSCPVGYNAHTLSGKTSINQCQIHCVAGTYIANANDTVCSNVGDGYYSAASTVNYGSAGSRSQCPNGQLTGTQTATNQSQCQTSCQGATYYDSDTDQCENCPTGYTDNTTNGKSDITQCQRHCNGGTTTETYTPLLYLESSNSKQFIDTGYTLTGTHASGTAVVETLTTMSGTSSDAGNFFGNVYQTGGFSSNYKKGVFGVWMQPLSGQGKKAEYTGLTFTAGQQYTIDFDVSVSGTTETAVIDVNNSNSPKNNTLTNGSFNAAGNTFKLFTNGGAVKNGNTVITNNYGDKLFGGRIYSLQLYEGNTLVLDLIPARRESDSALGMYNQVNGEFYVNAGTGSFVAGADNGATFAACSPVGNGYYVTANDTNYGSTGTRNACPNNLSTVDNGVIINNATSIYQCDTITECTGATYPDLTTGLCTSCPTGYNFNTQNGKETVYECQIHCSGGTYLAYANDATCTNVGDGYYAAADTINWGSIGTRHRCPDGDPTNKENASDVSECQAVANVCTGATYMNLGVCVPCPTGYNGNTSNGKDAEDECQIICPEGSYIATANDSSCSDAGVGYWATGGAVNYGSTSNRTACASGLTTVGYGHGADELADCGRKLHIGNYILYAKTTKSTTHALGIQPTNGSVYYIGASDTDHTLTPLHVTQGNSQYTLFDESILYGERDFETNTRVTQ